MVSKAKVNLGDGLPQYMAAADETVQQLLASDSRFVAALLQYDSYFREDLWDYAPPNPTFGFVLFLNAYQLFSPGSAWP